MLSIHDMSTFIFLKCFQISVIIVETFLSLTYFLLQAEYIFYTLTNSFFCIYLQQKRRSEKLCDE